MSENFTTMHKTTPKSVGIPKGKNRELSRLKELLEYAESRYHCDFSVKFREQITEEILDENKKFKVPNQKAIDALIKEWKIWEPYVSPESFSSFIGDGIKSIIEIQVSATFHSPALKGYIGNKAKVIKELPGALSTFVSSTGALGINGTMVS